MIRHYFIFYGRENMWDRIKDATYTYRSAVDTRIRVKLIGH